jgi:hypothetical protein
MRQLDWGNGRWKVGAACGNAVPRHLIAGVVISMFMVNQHQTDVWFFAKGRRIEAPTMRSTVIVAAPDPSRFGPHRSVCSGLARGSPRSLPNGCRPAWYTVPGVRFGNSHGDARGGMMAL